MEQLKKKKKKRYSSRIVRKASDSGFDSIRQYIRSDPVWSNVLFWQELLFGSLNKQLKQLPSSTPKKEKKLAMKLSLSMLQMMSKVLILKKEKKRERRT